MADWYPAANKANPGRDAGTFISTYKKKGVIHKTEGSSVSGAIGAYRSANSWPHFTVGTAGDVHQHLALSRAGRALQNLSGGVETNRGGAIQIELVGYSKNASLPSAQELAMKALMRWIEANAGVQQYGPRFGGQEQYGQRNPFEFSHSYWISFNGWCGHQHVPENSHWDPGALDLSRLLVQAPAPVPVPVPGIQIPSFYHAEVPQVPFTATRPQGGHIVVGGDGGVFAYDAPFYGSLGGVALGTPIIDAVWTKTGAGYYLLSSDGAIFGFGDGVYKGGFNGFPASVKGNRRPIGVVLAGNGYLIITLDPSNDGSPFDAYGFGV
jgi:hypothetical protein